MTRQPGRKKALAAAAGVAADGKRMQEDFGVEDAFCSIRHNRNTQLENQKLALSLLDATEATLREKGLAYEPASYFLALWPLVDNDEKEEAGKMDKGQAATFNTAAMYLISFVAPKLPAEFICKHYSAIYSKLPAALGRFLEVAPFVRTAIVFIQAVLAAFPSEAWNERPSLGELSCTLLQLAVDSRPKVRKLAQDSLLGIVRSGVFGPDHPAKDDLVKFLRGVLERTTRKESADALYAIPLLRSLAPRLTAEEVAEIVDPLLHAASLGNSHLTVAAYNLIALLCDLAGESPVQIDYSKIVPSLAGQRPEVTITDLLPAWINAYSKALVASSRKSPASVPDLELSFQLVSEYFLSTDEKVHQAVEDALRILYQLVKDEAFGARLCDQLGKWLQIKNGPAVPNVIRTAGDFCDEAGVDALPVAGELLKLLATMHDTKQARHAGLIEAAIGKYIARCGPEAVLALIPLNLDGAKGATPRAWLLPILKDNTSYARLGYFVKELVPLVERLERKSEEYAQGGKANDAKIYKVIVHQIWACLHGFLMFPTDFAEAFEGIAPILGRQLNGDVQLRPVIANALTAFIQRNRAMAIEGDEPVDSDNADLEALARYCGNFLPILFNVYGVTVAEQRGYLLECIEAFISICDPSAVQVYFDRIVGRLGASAAPAELVSLLELSTVLAKRLGLEQQRRLMTAVLPLITAHDVTVQKRAYRTIADLLSREDYPLSEDLEALERALLNAYNGRIDSSVKKGRFRVLLTATAHLPDGALHWIPLFLPETVLGTKEVNQQARLTAFDLLLAFARRMSRENGGAIRAERTGGMLAEDVPASLGEFMTMLLAGLAGATPHMISATIMAIARILFEMRTAIDGELLDVLLGDIISLLHSPSREVVKSSLGFIKVALAALRPTEDAEKGAADLLGNHLNELIPGLLNWANEHHQQFKVRVRHLMERLVRRFGIDRIWDLTPVEHRKLLTNIRKRKERAKRQKQQGTDASDGERDDPHDEMAALTTAALSKTTMLAKGSAGKAARPSGFEEALYESESELGDSDDDLEIPADSILHDLQGLEGDEEIERVLSRKLSLATALNSQRTAKGAKSTGKRMAESDDDDAVRMGEDGKLMISDEEEADGTALDSDEDEQPVKKAVQSAPKRAKKQQGDAKHRGDNYEPYSYLPMIRTSKKPSGGSGKGAGGKKTPKYYMKRS